MTNPTASLRLPTAPSAPDIDRDYSEAVMLGFGGLMRVATRVWFRFRIRGLDALPDRPVLLVGNHSGIGIAEVLCILGAWAGRFGGGRRAVGLMHDLFVAAPLVGRLCRAFGAVRASPEAARSAVARGYDVLVYPGGDLDACRPMTRPREVDFGPRRGYVRLALESGRPVVPVVTLGSHHSYLLLPLDPVWEAVHLRRWSRLTRFPVTVAAVTLVAALVATTMGALSPWWVLAAALAALVPNPVRITTVVLPALDLRALTAHVADRAERVEVAHRIVHGALAEALRTLRHDPR